MDTMLTIWYLNTYCRHRGYDLSKEELKELVPYSDRTMKKKLLQWQKEQRQGGE